MGDKQILEWGEDGETWQIDQQITTNDSQTFQIRPACSQLTKSI